MAALNAQEPAFYGGYGNVNEPDSIPFPIAPNVTFRRGDFLILGTGIASPSSNTSAVAPPPAPGLATATTGGTILAGVYGVKTTYLNALGETTVSAESFITTTGTTSTITVASPPPTPGAAQYKVYMTLINGASGSETLQGVATNIGTAFVQTAPPTSGAAVPASNTTGLPTPAAPTTGSTAGGTLVAATYSIKVTYVNAAGESLASAATSQAVAANNLFTVTSPAAQVSANGYNVYAATTAGQEVKQNATPIALGTNFTEATTGLVGLGLAKATSNLLTGFVGMAESNSSDVYVGSVGQGATAPLWPAYLDAALFGAAAAVPGTGLMPNEPANTHVAAFHNGAPFEVTLAVAVAYNPGMIGQQVGIGIDATTNFFVADPTLSNKVATIIGSVDGPFRGAPGDTGKRVVIQFLPTAVAI